MPMCTKALWSAFLVTQLIGKLLEVIRCFSKAVPGHPMAQLDVSSCCNSNSVCWPLLASSYCDYCVHSYLSSFVEVKVYKLINNTKSHFSQVVDCMIFKGSN